MLIRVNDDWVIDFDVNSYAPMKDYHRKKTVNRRGTEKETDAYGPAIGYYTSLKGALRAIAQVEYKNALTGRETPLNEAIQLLDETIAKFEKILDGIRE